MHIQLRPQYVWAPLLLVALMAGGCERNDPAQPNLDSDSMDHVPEYDGTLDEELAELNKHGFFTGFSRVDRMGMPAIATAVITSKDAYNQADPVDDAAGVFVDEIVANVDFLHTALDDDLTGLGLTPCATADCVGQAAPLVVPDVITLDVSQPAGFPNGRRLEDPVIDVTLAVVLLDLGVHGPTTLVGVNPTANDKQFRSRFPYLARPHRSW